MQRDLDVLVAGAGPVGLFAAYSLARAGKSVGIVDPGIRPCAHSYALALHPRSVDLLCKAGIGMGTFEQACAVRCMAFYEGASRRAEVQFGGQPLLVVPQSVVEESLEDALAAAGVKVDWRHKVMRVEQGNGGARAAIDRYEQDSCGYVVARSKWVVAKSWTVDVPFVIGADGYDSTVRRSLAIDYPEVAPCQWYAVFEFSSDADLPNEVRVVVGERTTDVLQMSCGRSATAYTGGASS
jgi:2-polyprenyl-6-methoxyphenol hydroxylase-like FAD-dependent oxidoreductase